jgi:glycosyltransferase involved in cell wall biosynthesis
VALRRRAVDALDADDAVILRVPGPIGTLIARQALKHNRPFGVEVLGDPREVFRGGVRSILSPLIGRRFAADLRWQCQQACAAAYVTERHLQERYPPGGTSFHTHYTSVDLTDESFAPAARNFDAPPAPLRIVTIGSLQQHYKGTDVLIDSIARLRSTEKEAGAIDVRLRVVGDGRYRRALERRTARLRLADRVTFLGHVSHERVKAALDGAELFVLPSRSEGLPRAMIEAMARGLPCIVSRVGGIPELINDTALVPPNDAIALASCIAAIARNTDRLNDMSRRNLEKARQFHADAVRPRRRRMYEEVRDRTARWIERNAADFTV